MFSTRSVWHTSWNRVTMLGASSPAFSASTLGAAGAGAAGAGAGAAGAADAVGTADAADAADAVDTAGSTVASAASAASGTGSIPSRKHLPNWALRRSFSCWMVESSSSAASRHSSTPSSSAARSSAVSPCSKSTLPTWRENWSKAPRSMAPQLFDSGSSVELIATGTYASRLPRAPTQRMISCLSEEYTRKQSISGTRNSESSLS